MAGQIMVRSPAVNRRQGFLSGKHHHVGSVPVGLGAPGRIHKNRVSEMAGKTAADITALCCCCPCTVMNILVLAVYKLPADLCRKASMRKRKRSAAKALSSKIANDGAAANDAAEDSVADLLNKGGGGGDDTAADDLEKEMWARFHSTGFWRSPSMRDT